MTKLTKIVESISKKHVYIQTHNFPDPDAIASAFGLQYLLKKKNIESTICYFGEIDRYSTVQMVKELEIEIYNVKNLNSLGNTDEIILVDSQKGNVNIEDISGEEVICIDHHPNYEKYDYKFADIRDNTGACASIIAEYFFENNIDIPTNVATALIYGIKIDTANLSRGVSQLDLDMFYRIYNICDKKVLENLEHSVLQWEDLKAFVNVFDTIKVYDGVCFANTGKNCPEALIATISDFVMSISDVKISVVYSKKEDGVKLSVRCKIKTFDAGRITEQALKGIGNGGGHSHMAGGFVPFNERYRSDEDIISAIQLRFMNEVAKKENAANMENL